MLKGNLLKGILIILYSLIFVSNYRYFLLSIFSICIHEIAHILYLKFNAVNNIDLLISFLGFKIELNNNMNNNKVLVLYLIGSFSNIVTSLLVFLFNTFLGLDVLIEFAIIGLIIGVINLIPAFPLDGIEVFKNILLRKFRYRTVELISIFISFISGVIIILCGSYFYSIHMVAFNTTYIIIGIFVFVNTYKEYKTFKRIDSIRKYDFNSMRCIKSKFVLLEDGMELGDISSLCEYDHVDMIYIVNRKFEIVGILNKEK